MPEHEIIKSLEREGFLIEYPDTHSSEEKIILILEEKEKRLNLAIPLLLERNFDYGKIKENLLRLKDGKSLLQEFDKIIVITEEIFRRLKKGSESLSRIIKENKIKAHFTEKEFEYYLEEFKESKRNLEKGNFEKGDLEKRKMIESFNALEKIFSPAKLRILRKIYKFEDLTDTEKMYYYRGIKPIIDAILDKNLQGYLQIILGNRSGKK